MTQVDEDWHRFVWDQKEHELDAMIHDEKLKPNETRKFIEGSFREGVLKTTGTDIDKILPPTSLFLDGGRTAMKQSIIIKLRSFFEKYFGLG